MFSFLSRLRGKGEAGQETGKTPPEASFRASPSRMPGSDAVADAVPQAGMDELQAAYDLGVRGAYVEAVDIWTRLAEAGDPRAATSLAACFADGRGVKADRSEALRWLRRAADGGDPVGQRNLASALFQGLGGERDEVAAYGWFRRAAEGGDLHAADMVSWMLLTGHGTAIDPIAAHEFAVMAADAGLAGAMTRLGQIHSGGLGQPMDQALAVEWWTKAAELGDADATALLGIACLRGEGVEKEPFRAVVLMLIGRRFGSKLADATLMEALHALSREQQTEAILLSEDIARQPPWSAG